jgi:hypothetical protein
MTVQPLTITSFLARGEEKWDHESSRIDLVCRACTSREVCKAMVDAEKQILSRGAVLPPIGPFAGSCQVWSSLLCLSSNSESC